MKGLRPLHASQELKRDFFDNLRPGWFHASPVFFVAYYFCSLYARTSNTVASGAPLVDRQRRFT